MFDQDVLLNHAAMMQMVIDNKVSHFNCTVHTVLVHVAVVLVDTLINVLLPHPPQIILSHPLMYIFPDFFKNGPAGSVKHEIKMKVSVNTVPSRMRAHNVYGISAHPPLWAQFSAKI